MSITCAHCRTAVEAISVGGGVYFGSDIGGPGGMRVHRLAGTYRCPRRECGYPSLLFLTYTTDRDYTSRHEVVRQFPRGRAAEMPGLPDEIAADRDEAWSCFHGGDHRAAVIMGRAAIQRAARSLSAEGGNLAGQIDDLAAKGVIIRSLKETAHEVRIAGNEAAHPDTLGVVTRDEAEESLTFMDKFLDNAIATPALLAARKAARES